jgi:predicted ribosomally synthesized peptide with nif11-like leader
MKSAKAFIKSLRASGALQERISQSDWSIDAIVSTGASAGFMFTGEDYQAAYAELSREELSAVVGGVGCGPSWKEPTP